MRSRDQVQWLHAAADITSGYRPGELFYEIRDPMLGEQGELRIGALAYADTEGLILQVSSHRVTSGVELLWAFGGVNGQRGRRDGDIGTEAVPIDRWDHPAELFAVLDDPQPATRICSWQARRITCRADSTTAKSS